MSVVMTLKCAKCNRYPDTIEVSCNEALMQYLFVCFCHGEVDRCVVDYQFLMSCGGTMEGWCFVDKIAPGPEKEPMALPYFGIINRD